MQDIPQYNTFVKVEPVNKGWSKDKKYYIETRAGEKLLLRLADGSAYDQKKAEYTALTVMSELDINMSMPIDFGLCSDGNHVYTLLTWVEGEDSELVLPTLPENRQYQAGLEAGKVLNKIHTIPAPPSQEPWGARYNRKVDRYIELYRKCGHKLPQEQKFLRYLEANRHLLSGREQCIQHGDYHVGNLIISPAGNIGVVDFNRHDFGDPWEEFNRIVWSVHVSKAFAVGQLHGYFAGEPPQDFFRLMAFYIAANALASIPWAIPFGQKEIDVMERNAAEILAYYQGFQRIVPTWYFGSEGC